MSSLLPDYADPARLCSLGKVYEGKIALAEMPRLVELLTEDSGEARFRLEFGRDGERRLTVQVRVEAELPLQCQRCLGAMRHRIDAKARLAVVHGPLEAERLPDELDPLLVEDDRIALRGLLEDELILAVPNAPMHPVDQCAVDLRQLNAPSPQASGLAAPGNSPFAALAGLKGERNPHD